MRIISGKAGGIVLQAPEGEVRPTTDRVREALFSILGERVPGTSILDLFAGSGAFGLEALSRGAASVRMVEHSRRACNVIRSNMEKARLSGATIICADAVALVKREAFRTSGMYDLIFADPPYCKGPGDRDFIGEIIEAGVCQLLKENGFFIAEAWREWGVAGRAVPEVGGLRLLDARDYGKNVIMIYGRSQDYPLQS